MLVVSSTSSLKSVGCDGSNGRTRGPVAESARSIVGGTGVGITGVAPSPSSTASLARADRQSPLRTAGVEAAEIQG
jgi:hypothetical protein